MLLLTESLLAQKVLPGVSPRTWFALLAVSPRLSALLRRFLREDLGSFDARAFANFDFVGLARACPRLTALTLRPAADIESSQTKKVGFAAFLRGLVQSGLAADLLRMQRAALLPRVGRWVLCRHEKRRG